MQYRIVSRPRPGFPGEPFTIEGADTLPDARRKRDYWAARGVYDADTRQTVVIVPAQPFNLWAMPEF